MLSICQWLNLAWQFQVQFPILHLAILIALCAAAKPVTRAAMRQDLTDEQLAALCPQSSLPKAIERLRALRTGPFRELDKAVF
jgi:hypothetical protein